jgi:hypothetical protein
MVYLLVSETLSARMLALRSYLGPGSLVRVLIFMRCRDRGEAWLANVSFGRAGDRESDAVTHPPPQTNARAIGH